MRPARLQPLVNGVLRRAARHHRSKPFAMRNTAPLVSFTFDDVPASAYTNGAAILEDHGLRGTFYIASGTLGETDTDWRVIDRDQVRALHDRGHEIGCHTFLARRCRRARCGGVGRGMPAQPGSVARTMRRRRSDQLLLSVRPRVAAAQAASSNARYRQLPRHLRRHQCRDRRSLAAAGDRALRPHADAREAARAYCARPASATAG